MTHPRLRKLTMRELACAVQAHAWELMRATRVKPGETVTLSSECDYVGVRVTVTVEGKESRQVVPPGNAEPGAQEFRT